MGKFDLDLLAAIGILVLGVLLLVDVLSLEVVVGAVLVVYGALRLAAKV